MSTRHAKTLSHRTSYWIGLLTGALTCSLHQGSLYKNVSPLLPPSCYGVDGRLWCWQAFYGLTQTIKKHTWGLLQVLCYMNIPGSITTQCWINHKVTYVTEYSFRSKWLSDHLFQTCSHLVANETVFQCWGGQSGLNRTLCARLSVTGQNVSCVVLHSGIPCKMYSPVSLPMFLGPK